MPPARTLWDAKLCTRIVVNISEVCNLQIEKKQQMVEPKSVNVHLTYGKTKVSLPALSHSVLLLTPCLRFSLIGHSIAPGRRKTEKSTKSFHLTLLQRRVSRSKHVKDQTPSERRLSPTSLAFPSMSHSQSGLTSPHYPKRRKVTSRSLSKWVNSKLYTWLHKRQRYDYNLFSPFLFLFSLSFSPSLFFLFPSFVSFWLFYNFRCPILLMSIFARCSVVLAICPGYLFSHCL